MIINKNHQKKTKVKVKTIVEKCIGGFDAYWHCNFNN